jgi:hypothetical protein
MKAARRILVNHELDDEYEWNEYASEASEAGGRIGKVRRKTSECSRDRKVMRGDKSGYRTVIYGRV